VLAHTSNVLVGATARQNRQLLKSSMAGAGFRPYAREWWHFELIDEPFDGDGFDFEVSARGGKSQTP
jgi:D-alanyl-D-alanine dipeptidase